MYINDFNTLGLIVLIPLLGGIINGIFGSKLSKPWVNFIGISAVGLSFALAISAVRTLYQTEADGLTYVAYKWIYSGSMGVDISFMLDHLSAVMVLVVTGVGFLIHIYSAGYMDGDPGEWKFFSYLNLFIFAMLMLILGKNMIVTFIGWEGVGACSYLLIGFWFTDDEKAKAGQKAFIVNRIGDFAFLLGLFLLFWETGTFDYIEINRMAIEAGPAQALHGVATAAVLLIFIGATGKSAQIPLYTWLPDAMAGPTPVSALIHAATMVTSGIYLLSRLNHVVTLAPEAMGVIAIVGALTAFFAATIAIVQTDIKGVLAYSTVSQLGYMFIAIGVGSFTGAVFHLMTHAFFKACLFLGSGSVIHAMGGEQEITKMGGLKKYMPITHITFGVSTLAISGFPFLAGFFSKDLILWGALSNTHVFSIVGVENKINYLINMVATPIQSGASLPTEGWVPIAFIIAFALGLITAGMTAFYMFRLYFMTFWGDFRGGEKLRSHLHESPLSMTIPLMVLAVLALVGGFGGFPHFMVHWAGDAQWMLGFEHWLAPVFESTHTYRIVNRFGAHAATQEMIGTGISVALGLLGIGSAYYAYIVNPNVPRQLKQRFATVHRTLISKYKVDEFYDFVFVGGTILVGKISYIFDQYILDTSVNFIGRFFESIGRVLRNLQSGNVQRYATYIILAIVLCLIAIGSVNV